MKAFKRSDFINLPSGTIYSRIEQNDPGLFSGLFCKTSGPEYTVDWVEQDLLSEPGYPNGLHDGADAFDYQLNLRDTFQDFETDLQCGGRDGMFEDNDRFVVWDKKDITKLRDYLNESLKLF